LFSLINDKINLKNTLCFIQKKFYIRRPKNRLLSFVLVKELLIENQSVAGEGKRLQNKNKNKK
jgi:hypothetical protein